VGRSLTAPDGRLFHVNEEFARIAGRTIAGMHRVRFADITHPEDVTESSDLVRQALAGEMSSFRVEKRYVRPDGTVVWTDVTTRLLRDPRGAPRFFVTDILDVSERKQAEGALRAALEDLRRSNADLEQFAYVASHDLQEPLRVVASFAELIAEATRDGPDPDVARHATRVVGGAKRMQALVNDLLAYARIGASARPFEPVDLHAVVDEVLADLALAIRDKGAEVHVRPLPELPADRTQIALLLRNLLSNALKFQADAPPRVEISARLEERAWAISVADNGIGIDPAHHERIFAIFQRLHRRDEFPGTGIGLALARRIAERHGGALRVASEVGRGACFTFTIPAEQRRRENSNGTDGQVAPG